MTQEEVAKIIEAIYDKYDKAEASLLIVKFVQAWSPPIPYTSNQPTSPQITPLVTPYDPVTNPITHPSITWQTGEAT